MDQATLSDMEYLLLYFNLSLICFLSIITILRYILEQILLLTLLLLGAQMKVTHNCQVQKNRRWWTEQLNARQTADSLESSHWPARITTIPHITSALHLHSCQVSKQIVRSVTDTDVINEVNRIINNPVGDVWLWFYCYLLMRSTEHSLQFLCGFQHIAYFI